MVEVLIPKTKIEEIKNPLIFLAGPIRGTSNWHSTAVEIFDSYNVPLTIASPSKRINFASDTISLIPESNDFPRQRAWENHYLKLASKNGVILFWLPGETEHDCQKSYGAMTRIELGQWMIEYKYDNSTRLCIGTDGSFSEFKTIEYDLSLNAPDIKINQTLETTCQQAIDIIQSRKQII